MIDLTLPGLDSPSSLQLIGDADTTLPATFRRAIVNTNLTAARTVTLPLANSLPAGTPVYISAASGRIPKTCALTLQRQGSDLVNGATQVSTLTHGLLVLHPDGVSSWTTSRFPAVNLEVDTQEDMTGSTLQASTNLSRYVGPGKYLVRFAYLIANATAANGTKSDVTFSGTATYRAFASYFMGSATNATTVANVNLQLAQATLSGPDALAVDGNSSGARLFVREFIMNVTAGGTLSLRYAGWSGATVTSLAVGSQLKIEPIR